MWQCEEKARVTNRFDSPSDKVSCENTLRMLKRNSTRNLQSPDEIPGSMDEELERALDPSTSPFALTSDALAMQR